MVVRLCCVINILSNIYTELKYYLDKNILYKCENNERSIEIHYVYEDEEKSLLTKVHFPFDSDVSMFKNTFIITVTKSNFYMYNTSSHLA